MSRKSRPKKQSHGGGGKPTTRPSESAPGIESPGPAASSAGPDSTPRPAPGRGKKPVSPGTFAHLLPALGMMLVVLAGFGLMLHFFPTTFWKQAPGVITRAEIEESSTRVKVWNDIHRDYEYEDMPAWIPRVFYTYEVGGEAYSSSGAPPGIKPSVERKPAEDWIQKHENGTSVTVHYRRERPATSTLIPPPSFLDAVLTIGAILLLVIFLVLFSHPRRGRSGHLDFADSSR